MLTLGAVVLFIVSSCSSDTAKQDGAATGDEIESGTVVATEGGLEGGRIWFVWEGEKARIYQPRPLTDADLEDLGLSIGDPAPRRLALGSASDSIAFFAVHPPDGPEARLYLAEAGELHLITIMDGLDDRVEGLPQLDPTFVTRARTGAAASPSPIGS